MKTSTKSTMPMLQEKSVTAHGDQGLQTLEGVRPLYMLPTDPFAEEVLIPGSQVAGKVK